MQSDKDSEIIRVQSAAPNEISSAAALPPVKSSTMTVLAQALTGDKINRQCCSRGI